jgi:hypothetical protein
MHGLIFAELKKYAETRLGANAWSALLKEAGLSGKLYLTVESYPDSDVLALVGAATRITGGQAATILEDFGEFITPDLMAMYAAFIPKEWGTLEFLENVERTIHRTVRMRNPGAEPPKIHARRSQPNQVTITYSSARRLCALARGLVRGVAKHYGQKVAVDEPECMMTGAAECTIRVTGQS